MYLTLEQVKIFAKAAHGKQMWGNEPYWNHLRAVANELTFFLGEFAVSNWLSDLVMAAWLHDILEDTSVTEQDLFELVPSQVIGLVVAVTNAPGANRNERNHKTYPKIRNFGTLAIALKLADRIVNVRKGVNENSPLLSMYVKEYGHFVTLEHGGELSTMWKMLDDLMNQAKKLCQK